MAEDSECTHSQARDNHTAKFEEMAKGAEIEAAARAEKVVHVGHPNDRHYPEPPDPAPLMALINSKTPARVELALSAGADPNLPEIWRGEGTKIYPLTRAFEIASEAIVHLLLEYGAEVGKVDLGELLGAAIWPGNSLECVQIAVSLGAVPGIEHINRIADQWNWEYPNDTARKIAHFLFHRFPSAAGFLVPILGNRCSARVFLRDCEIPEETLDAAKPPLEKMSAPRKIPESYDYSSNALAGQSMVLAARVVNLGCPNTYIRNPGIISENLDNTPLVVLIEHGYPEWVEIALDAGADSNLPQVWRRTGMEVYPLTKAFNTGSDAIVRLLLARGADVGKVNVGELLGAAIWPGESLGCVKIAISLGAVPTKEDFRRIADRCDKVDPPTHPMNSEFVKIWQFLCETFPAVADSLAGELKQKFGDWMKKAADTPKTIHF